MAQDAAQIAQDDPILTTVEAGRLLGYGRHTIRDLAEQGDLPGAYRAPGGGHWRIPTSAVEAFKQKNSPQHTQTSGPGVATHGDPEPGPQEGGGSAEMPAGSLTVNRAGVAQEEPDGRRAASA